MRFNIVNRMNSDSTHCRAPLLKVFLLHLQPGFSLILIMSLFWFNAIGKSLFLHFEISYFRGTKSLSNLLNHDLYFLIFHHYIWCYLNGDKKLNIYQIICGGLYTGYPYHFKSIVEFCWMSSLPFKLNVKFFI